MARLDVQAGFEEGKMLNSAAMDDLLEDAILERHYGDRDFNPLEQKPFVDHRLDRNLALEWFASRRLPHTTTTSDLEKSATAQMVSFSEIRRAIVALGSALFGKR